jgi:hypothetical protein
MPDSWNNSRQLVVWCLVVGMTAGACAGCSYAQKSKTARFFSFRTHHKKDPTITIQTPADKIEELRVMADEAPQMAMDVQEKNALELTQRIQVEEDTLVRAQIIKTMAAFKTNTATAVLNASVHDADRDVRIACCDAWCTRGGPEGTRMLAELLSSDTDLDVRMAAARALGKLENPEAVKALSVALDDQNPAMQNRAKVSIEKVTKKEFKNINECRDFVKNGREPTPTTIAERLRNLF